MKAWERTVSTIGPRRILLTLSVAFVVAGVIQVGLLAVSAPSVEGAVTDFVLIGGPGLALLYGVRRLPTTGIEPESYPHVARWVLGGAAVLVVALGLLVLNPEGEITRPLRATAMAAGFGAIGGYLVGVNEARAVSRAREAERHNRELEQVRAQLEETVDRLAETNDRLETSNERLEQFAYAASHDLQEPLRMVSSYLELLESQHADELDADAREYIDFAVDGADRMRDMIEGLLEYSRVESEGESFHSVDVADVLDGARENLQLRIRESDAEITVEDLPVVRGDYRQLRQVFQNLLANAIEYSGDGRPRIHVSAERREGLDEATGDAVNGLRGGEPASSEPAEPSPGPRADGSAAATDESMWHVSVRDEGIGIDPAYQDRIFEVFERLQARSASEGTGIGLALCERIVDRHGGAIRVDSEPGNGATFTVSLPPAERDRDGNAN